MTTTRLMGLAKVFENLGWAEAFMGGCLYMNPIARFRDHHDRSGALRGDPYEDLAGIFQPSRLGSIRFGEIEISPDSLAAPLLIHNDAAFSWNVFCMYSLNSRGWGATASAATLADMKRTLQMDHACRGLGDHVVVVTNALEFQHRVEAALRKTRFEARCDLVDYYDPATYHGFFEQHKAPFMKRKAFEYQREWRVVLKRLPEMMEAYSLPVGDLRDITMLTTVAQFNQLLELRLPDGSHA